MIVYDTQGNQVTQEKYDALVRKIRTFSENAKGHLESCCLRNPDDSRMLCTCGLSEFQRVTNEA